MGDTNTVMSLAEIKAAVKANLGTPPANANAAKTLEGQKFWAENAKGTRVLAVMLGTVSKHDKCMAEMKCSVEGCNETHVREMSDWHQSMRCATHAVVAKAKLTDEEKLARKVAKAKALIAAQNAKVEVVDVVEPAES